MSSAVRIQEFVAFGVGEGHNRLAVDGADVQRSIGGDFKPHIMLGVYHYVLVLLDGALGEVIGQDTEDLLYHLLLRHFCAS